MNLRAGGMAGVLLLLLACCCTLPRGTAADAGPETGPPELNLAGAAAAAAADAGPEAGPPELNLVDAGAAAAAADTGPEAGPPELNLAGAAAAAADTGPEAGPPELNLAGAAAAAADAGPEAGPPELNLADAGAAAAGPEAGPPELNLAGAGAAAAAAADPVCPASCENIFQKLEPAVRGKVQDVEIQVRGEPKSGTGMMAEWAWGALAHACLYLQRLYGKSSCAITWQTRPDRPGMPGYPHSIVFEPLLGKRDVTPPRCQCNSIRVVRIKMSAVHKHELPVSPDCSWHRTPGATSGKDRVCERLDDTPMVNRAGLWECVREGDCLYTDERPQLAVLRHPGAVTVSAYYQFLRQNMFRPEKMKEQEGEGGGGLVDIDRYFVAHLPAEAKWMSVRYFLYSELLPKNQTEVFWYEDAVADPVEWHRRYFSFVGITLPPPLVQRAAEIALRGTNATASALEADREEAGGGERTPSAEQRRDFRAELKPDTLAYMDSVLRIWLPPELLERLGAV